MSGRKLLDPTTYNKNSGWWNDSIPLIWRLSKGLWVRLKWNNLTQGKGQLQACWARSWTHDFLKQTGNFLTRWKTGIVKNNYAVWNLLITRRPAVWSVRLFTQEILFSSLSLISQKTWMFSKTSVEISYSAPLAVCLAAQCWMGGTVVNDELEVAFA